MAGFTKGPARRPRADVDVADEAASGLLVIGQDTVFVHPAADGGGQVVDAVILDHAAPADNA